MINRIKNKIYALLFWQTSIGEYFNKMYDLNTFFKYSFNVNKTISKQSEVATLTKEYHIVEKGLALPKTRVEFGKEKITKLIQKATEYQKAHGDDYLITAIQSCLVEYYQFNKENQVDLNSAFFKSIHQFVNNQSISDFGGTKEVTKSEIIEATNFDYHRFVTTRSSIRDFDSSEIDLTQLQEAISLARHTPSVCNRQSWRAHLYTDKQKVLQVLQFQNGHAGFKESIKAIFVITTDVAMFTKLETNQIFIDGGLFAMSVMNALHSKQIGSCPLNTCLPFVDEIKLKKTVAIPPNERVIMMIGIGNLKEKYKVAKSFKRDLEQILIHHN